MESNKPTSGQRAIKIVVSNRKARFEYEILQKYECGIVLQGTEVKSLRAGKCNLQDSYASFENGEIFIHNLHIKEYDFGNRENHKPNRDRKLLLHLRELAKLKSQVEEKGLTIVPLSIYFSGHLVKVEIAVVRAKKKFDKREDVKKRDVEREIRRDFMR
ncbi:MAG: SsrA-binding protein SmpB [Candidatus Kapabacteria bacterium]|nr:SsrA-binding protein SmpB [Ignavibacteriota bacterium]MCW5883647.1 SsrA-binding protein SmpB [Candidatus Kapabacteria bacterium]